MRQLFLLSGILFLLTSFTFKNAEEPKVKIVHIQTSAVCEECKERIEEKLNYTKGIIFAELNLDNKVVTVKYKTKLITGEQIVKIVADLGYNANDLPRNEEAYNKLPKCCRNQGSCEPKK